MTAFSASVISGDIGFNVCFSFTVDGAEFGGVFYRADTVPAEIWAQLCAGAPASHVVKSTIPAGITHITTGATNSGASIIMFSLNGPPVFVATIYTDDLVTREVLRRLGARIAAAFVTLDEQSD